jgi:hypothetical protein
MMSESAEPLLGFNSVTTANNREDDDESESESRLALSEQHGTSTDTPRSLSLTTEEEFFCGCGPCHPPWLQWRVHPFLFLDSQGLFRVLTTDKEVHVTQQNLCMWGKILLYAVIVRSILCI